MSTSRDLVYSFADDLVLKAMKEGLPYLERPVEPGSDNDDRLHYLLNWVEDDRAHREAEKLRKRAEGFKDSASDLVAGAMAASMRLAADEIDPYEKRDGELYRKSDGSPVTL